MVFRDWTRPQDYAFTAGLDAAQWAWEFLRRNPRYQAEWRAFDVVWRDLEARYGRPPHRDFCAWRLDPRAWVPAGDCPDGDCRVDHDKVLIECALGARWGFHKFPPDPADDDPVGDGRLTWREVEEDIPQLSHGETGWLTDDPARVALGFDLSLPLRDQLERAKRRLQLLQRQRQRSGEVQPLSLRARRAGLAVLLRLLDAAAAGAADAELAAISDDWPGRLARARAMRDGGYRALPGLPD
jgi:hypothetical protein